MSKLKKQQMIIECEKLLDNAFRRDKNSIRLNVNNTIHHELAKTKKAYELIKDGHTILTEVIFKNGGRADILCLDTMQVFEILHSETKEEALRKEEYYPFELDIFYLTSEEVLGE